MEDRSLFKKFTWLKGKVVLDVACGCGGKTVYYVLNLSPNIAVGIDLDYERLKVGAVFSREKSVSNKLSFVRADAGFLPFRRDEFDMVIMNLCFEHFSNPSRVLHEGSRVLVKSGEILINFEPYLSMWGAHIAHLVPIPWCHILFSDETLVKAVKGSLRNSIVDFTDFDFNTICDFACLNQMTISKFRHIVQSSSSSLNLEYFTLLPSSFQNYPFSLLNWFTRLLVRIPFVREFFTYQVITKLKKVKESEP